MIMLRDAAIGNHPINPADFANHAEAFPPKLTGVRHDGDLLRHLTHHLIKMRFTRMWRSDPCFETESIYT